jgi:SMC interacting uncharacterized protein involved in chromosome segregation
MKKDLGCFSESVKVPMNLQFFASDSSGSDGEGEGEPGADENTGKDDSAGAIKESKTFTQAEVTAMMAKEKAQGKMSVLKELGVENAKNAKDALAAHKAYLDSQKSDAEKKTEELALLVTEKQKLEQEVIMSKAQVEALKIGIKPEYLDAAITLALKETTSPDDIVKVFEGMKEKFSVFFNIANSDDKDTKPKGTGGTLNQNNSGGKEKFSLGAEMAKAKSQPVKSSYFTRQ